MSKDRRFNVHSKLDYFYSPSRESGEPLDVNHCVAKTDEKKRKNNALVKMLDALKLSSYETRDRLNNNTVIVPPLTKRSGSYQRDKQLVKGIINDCKDIRSDEIDVYTKSFKSSPERPFQLDDSIDSHSESAYSQFSEFSRDSDLHAVNMTSSDSDKLNVYRQIIRTDSSRYHTITVHTPSGLTIEFEVHVNKTVVMLMKIILWLRQRGVTVCQRPSLRESLASPLNCIEDGSGDEKLSSLETIKPQKSPKKISFSPNTLLLSAVTEKAFHEAKVILESDCDIDVNVQTPNGQSLIHIAAGNADIKCVRLLLDYGADPNVPDCHGWGPLHAAVRQGKWKCAILLIEAGANFAEYAARRIQEYQDVQRMSRTCYRSMEIFV